MNQLKSIDKHRKTSCKKLLTRDEAKEYLRNQGMTVREFAKLNGFKAKAVYRVLNNELKCYYGDGHAIAVALRLKSPDVGNDSVTNH